MSAEDMVMTGRSRVRKDEHVIDIKLRFHTSIIITAAAEKLRMIPRDHLPFVRGRQHQRGHLIRSNQQREALLRNRRAAIVRVQRHRVASERRQWPGHGARRRIDPHPRRPRRQC